MDDFEDASAFGKRISAARGWMQVQRPEFGEFMGVSESTVWRWEEGDIGKKRANAEARRQFASWVQEKVGCPPDIVGLSGLEPGEADQLRKELEQKFDVELKAMAARQKVERAEELVPLEARLSQLERAVTKAK